MDHFRSHRTAFRCPKEPDRRESQRLLSGALLVGMLFLFVSLPWIQSAHADVGLLRGPRKIVRAGAEAPAHQGIMKNIAAAPVLFYQRFLGPSWGQRCPSYPSCSNYALLAIRKHGAVLGTIMAFDRLQHEANEVRHSPRIAAGGEIKVYDPLENNDYWWYTSGHRDPAAPLSADRQAMP